MEQVGEDGRILFLIDDIRHIGQRCQHLAGTVDETIHTLDILLNNLSSVDRSVTAFTLCGVVIEEIIIIVGDLFVAHVSFDEVNHRRGSHVVHHHQITAFVTFPVDAVGNIPAVHHLNGVIDRL